MCIRDRYGERAEKILLAKSRGIAVRFERGEEEYLAKPHTDTPFERVYIFDRFVRDEGYDEGKYTFQSVGSVAICGVVEPCERLLDACAAPGGKAVLLSKKCEEVTACELHPHRVSLIQAYCARMGAKNVTAIQADSTEFRTDWEEGFDGVLCDVPCSGLGTVAENPDLPLRKTEEDFRELVNTQRAILKNCACYVKSGGVLYYSTCSILEEENDRAVEELIKENPSFTAEEIDSPLAHEKTAYGLQFLPDTAFGAGFYVCKLKKRSEL
ncbi:MAG: methyltransferase domain-containing protein, partial [Clostridia bacterium]|nr:methyltransferase domain-containing protein [Clostridia bacterium]